MATKEAVKTASKPAAEKPKKAAEPKKNYVTTKTLADRVGAKPAAVRRYLRTIKSFQDGSYTRYKWDPETNKSDAQFLKDFEAGWEKHKVAEKEKNKKRLEEIKAKGKGSKTEAKGKKAKDEPEDEEEEEIEEDEEELA